MTRQSGVMRVTARS